MKILIIVLVKVGQERILTGYTRSKGRCNSDFGVVSGLWSYSDILVEAHPHIGTNKLPQIIQDIREKIIECGGRYCSKLE
jgi:uncharacterized FAD-dependent dehydrogenase